MSAEVNEGQPAGRAPDLLALTAMAAGAIGSVSLTLYAGLRIGAPGVLLVLFSAWVAFPFALLAVAYLVPRRPALTQLALRRSILVAPVGSLGLYGIAALGATRPNTAVFVLVAPVSLFVVGFIVATIVFGPGKRQ